MKKTNIQKDDIVIAKLGQKKLFILSDPYLKTFVSFWNKKETKKWCALAHDYSWYKDKHLIVEYGKEIVLDEYIKINI